ncbi:phosphate signaling complex protein PhoU [Aneurinibacillus tyrosinisolvens]|uniref:phosphate signaling complex protein PhoU n=1 Tax=Aneurinibacillus tyrosinisolvens TaxID=1443435 RepID=UPI00063F6EF6|nr:phosphate signaling complex protein PhoU [Aneurinibacillus tyrosinisolvens]
MQENQIMELKDKVLELAYLAQEGFIQSWKSFEEGNLEIAKGVIVRDEKLNVVAEKIFKMSLSLIALQAPVATDLRMVGSYLKIATDLERIGDLAVEIAKVVVRLGGSPYAISLFEIPTMAAKVHEMLDVGVEALRSWDTSRLRSLDEMDDVIDAYYSKCFNYLEVSMESNPAFVKEGAQLLKVIQTLERIGDHTTNLGEWTFYMTTGSIADLNT